MNEKILLSCPHMGSEELSFVNDAFDDNWVAPMGPHVFNFEKDLQEYLGIKKAVAMVSGTAAIHIALKLLGVESGDSVFVSSLTFIGSVNPVLYEKATPVFIDAEPDTWNMSPDALEKALKKANEVNQLPKAVIVVDLFGMPANYERIQKICQHYDVPIIEDAAESLGSSYKNKKCGAFGKMAILSFNGNKIITTGGGGMLVSDDVALMEKALFLITQARDPAPYYQHTQIGYNYRLSNVLAGIGRGQMKVLGERVQKRRAIYDHYTKALPQMEFFIEPEGSFSNRWLTTTCLPQDETRSPLELNKFLNEQNIESRPIWKPMHLQPLFSGCQYYAHNGWRGEAGVSDYIFDKGLCLPSASNYDLAVYQKVSDAITSWL